MRILVVSNLYPPAVRGGYEVECRDVVENLRLDHDVIVLTSDLEREHAPAGEAHVRRLLPWAEESKRNSLRAPRLAGPAVATARRVLAEHDPDLVFVWNGTRIPQAALRVIADGQRPLAFRVNEYWFGRLFAGDPFMRHLVPGERGLRGAWAAGVRAVNRRPGLLLDPRVPVVGASVAWATDFVRDKVAPPPAIQILHQETIIPVTAHSARFDGIERRPAQRPTLLFVGRLEEAKGPDIAIRAVRLLREAHGLQDVRLVLAGPGEAEPYRALAAAEGVEAEFTGPLAPERLGERIAEAHAWVVPSVWDEPSGMVVTEGALARVPLVVARAGGMPEVLVDEEQCLFFDRADPASCAAAVARTLQDPAASAARAERAYVRAQEIAIGPYLRHTREFLARALEADRLHRAGAAPSGLPRMSSPAAG